MTGEMYHIDAITGIEPDGTEWPIHAAIAQALGGTVQPFDQYQGPYVLIGTDCCVGTRPYQLAVQGLGVVRLWVVTDDGEEGRIYREDTDTMSYPFPLYLVAAAIAAAEELVGIDSGADW